MFWNWNINKYQIEGTAYSNFNDMLLSCIINDLLNIMYVIVQF